MNTKHASRLGRAVHRAYRELRGEQRPDVCAAMLRTIVRLTSTPRSRRYEMEKASARTPVEALWWAVGGANAELVDRYSAIHD